MSFKERKKGMPYGSIPYSEIFDKMEETEIENNDYELDYEKYLRSEIVDWSLDAPFFEYDHANRDPTISRTQLNVRYNGSRGGYEYPTHPELFYGFMDQDNRGLDNNPRMDEYKKQIDTRVDPTITVQMGYNNIDHIAERPWTNQSLNDMNRDIQTSLKYNTKVFINEYDGKAMNQNVLNNYDHNKKQLIYKDLLPDNTFYDTSNNGKSNNKHTVSSVPFVSYDSDYYASCSCKNVTNMIPNYKPPIRHISKDQLLQQSCINNNPEKNKLLLPNDKIHIKNDIKFRFCDEINNKKIDLMKLLSNNTSVSVLINEITNNTSQNQKQSMDFNPNIVNSVATIQCYTFQDYDVNYKNNTSLKQDNNMKNINNEITFPNTNENNSNKIIYKFSDNIQTNMTNNKLDTNMNGINEEKYNKKIYTFNDDIKNKTVNTTSEYIIDNTTENKINKNNNHHQEQKINNTVSEAVWKYSEENNIGKQQKQSRTSNTDDQVVTDIPEYADYNTYNSSKLMGRKSLRNDHMTNDDNKIYELLE